MMTLSGKIVDARKSKGMTQEELAEKSQVTVRTIQRIENGETVPRAYTLKAIAAVLEIPFEAINPEIIAETNTHQPIQTTGALAIEVNEEFLQTLCLSCFSYLVIPFLHFLIPGFLLKKNNPQSFSVKQFGNKLIKQQIGWVICLHALLLITVAYNLVFAKKEGIARPINYLIPVGVMYLINACLIIFKMKTIKKLEKANN